MNWAWVVGIAVTAVLGWGGIGASLYIADLREPGRADFYKQSVAHGGLARAYDRRLVAGLYWLGPQFFGLLDLSPGLRAAGGIGRIWWGRRQYRLDCRL